MLTRVPVPLLDAVALGVNDAESLLLAVPVVADGVSEGVREPGPYGYGKATNPFGVVFVVQYRTFSGKPYSGGTR